VQREHILDIRQLRYRVIYCLLQTDKNTHLLTEDASILENTILGNINNH